MTPEPLLDAELNIRVGVMCMNQKGLISKESLTASALMLLLTCLSHPAWSQESTGLKKIRIGMPNRGVSNLGLPAAPALRVLSSSRISRRVDRHAAKRFPPNFAGWRLGLFNGSCFRGARQCERSSSPH